MKSEPTHSQTQDYTYFSADVKDNYHANLLLRNLHAGTTLADLYAAGRSTIAKDRSIKAILVNYRLETVPW